VPDLLNPRLLEALNYAIELHGRDARKKTQVPVLAHLLSVCALVQQDGGTEDEAIAALLHDALEDKPERTSAAVILKRFESSDVCRLVQLCTDTPPDYAGGPKPPWRERKEWYLGQVRKESPKNLRVTVADKVDNLRAILADYRRIGESLWDRFNAPKGDQLWFYQAALDAYKEAGFNGPLLEEMDRLVTELVRVTA
jgi:(p)ppGpp synthase/HD superfamily hydrolase